MGFSSNSPYDKILSLHIMLEHISTHNKYSTYSHKKRPTTNRFHKNFNILSTKEDSVLSVLFFLITLYNFTSNVIFYVSFYVLYPSILNLCKLGLLPKSSVNCVLKYPRVTT